MPICPICDDTGLMNSDSTNPEFCYCAAGKKAKRQWENEQGGRSAVRGQSFIDIANLEQVNASVDAMRASLLGSGNEASLSSTKHPAVQMLYHVGHPGHEVTASEATQLYDLAKALEGFLGGLAGLSRNSRR
jgi:hypothetical protein